MFAIFAASAGSSAVAVTTSTRERPAMLTEMASRTLARTVLMVSSSTSSGVAAR